MMELRTLAVALCLAYVAVCQDFKADVSKVADEIEIEQPDYELVPLKGDWDGIKAPRFYVHTRKTEDVAESNVNDYDLEPIEASDAEEIHVVGVPLANPATAVEVGKVGSLTDSQYSSNTLNNYWQRLKELADKMNSDESSDDSDDSEDDSDDDSDESEDDSDDDSDESKGDDVAGIEGFSNKNYNNNFGKNEGDSDESDEDDSAGDSDESDEGEKDGYNGFKFKIWLPMDDFTQLTQAVKNAPADALVVKDPEQSNEQDTFDDMIGEDVDTEEVSLDDWLKSIDYSGYKYDALLRPTPTSNPKLNPDYSSYRKQQAADKDDDWWLYEQKTDDNNVHNNVQADISYAHKDAHGSVEADSRRRELYTAWHYIFFSFSGVLFLLGTVVMVGGMIRMLRYRRPNYILLAESGKVPL